MADAHLFGNNGFTLRALAHKIAAKAFEQRLPKKNGYQGASVPWWTDEGTSPIVDSYPSPTINITDVPFSSPASEKGNGAP